MPSIKVLIALIVAVALTKIAFFPSSGAQDQSAPEPQFAINAPTITVAKADISNSLTVEGQIVEDAPKEAKATMAGTVARLVYEDGAQVAAGEPILTLKKTEAQEPVTSTDEEGNTTTEQREPKVTWEDVYAPVGGTITYKVIKDQEATVGTVVATVAAGSYSAKGKVTAAQQYRLTNPPTEASVSVDSGPAPFSCTNLKIGTKDDQTSKTDPTTGDTTTTTGDGTSVEVRCSVPGDQQVFPGLKAKITIDAGSASDAIVVPVTAIEGNYSTGSVWVLSDPKKPSSAVKTEVSLGINDGKNVQVTEGLKEGATILQFVPGKDIQRTGTPNTCERDQSACYDENGKEIS